jgi:hypothetical protein
MFNVPWNSYRLLFGNSFKASILPCENVGNAKSLIDQARNLCFRVNGTGKQGHISAETVPEAMLNLLAARSTHFLYPETEGQDYGPSTLGEFPGNNEISSPIHVVIKIERPRLGAGHLQQGHHKGHVLGGKRRGWFASYAKIGVPKVCYVLMVCCLVAVGFVSIAAY